MTKPLLTALALGLASLDVNGALVAVGALGAGARTRALLAFRCLGGENERVVVRVRTWLARLSPWMVRLVTIFVLLMGMFLVLDALRWYVTGEFFISK